MALIQCRDCGKEISKRAYFCPGCGGYTKSGGPMLLTVGMVFGFVAVACFHIISCGLS